MDGLPVFLCKHTADMENRALSCVCGGRQRMGIYSVSACPARGRHTTSSNPLSRTPASRDQAAADLRVAGVDTFQTAEKCVMPNTFGGLENWFFTGPSGEQIELLKML